MRTDQRCNQPAYPLFTPAYGGFGPHQIMGMTLREYFAANALQGILANSAIYNKLDEAGFSGYEMGGRIAQCAINAADEIIEKLNHIEDES